MLNVDKKAPIPSIKAKEAEEIIDSAARDGFCEILMQNQEIIGAVIAEKSSFDTQHFGFGIGKIRHVAVFKHLATQQAVRANSKMIQKCEEWLKQKEVKCIIARADLNDADAIMSFQENGFVVFDVLTTFHLRTDVIPAEVKTMQEKLSAQFATARDELSLMEIACETLKFDHFHRDNRFPKDRSDDLFAKWVNNCCHGLADTVLVASERKTPFGFITCRKKFSGQSAYGVIDLIAVAANHQSKGLGKRLLREACRWFYQNSVYSVFVGTQAHNAAAVRLYENSGFRLASTELTFHKWLGDS